MSRAISGRAIILSLAIVVPGLTMIPTGAQVPDVQAAADQAEAEACDTTAWFSGVMLPTASVIHTFYMDSVETVKVRFDAWPSSLSVLQSLPPPLSSADYDVTLTYPDGYSVTKSPAFNDDGATTFLASDHVTSGSGTWKVELRVRHPNLQSSGLAPYSIHIMSSSESSDSQSVCANAAVSGCSNAYTQGLPVLDTRIACVELQKDPVVAVCASSTFLLSPIDNTPLKLCGNNVIKPAPPSSVYETPAVEALSVAWSASPDPVVDPTGGQLPSEVDSLLPITHYKVYRKIAPYDWVLWRWVPADANPLGTVDSGVACGSAARTYRVTAVSAAGESGPEPPDGLSVTPPACRA